MRSINQIGSAVLIASSLAFVANAHASSDATPSVVASATTAQAATTVPPTVVDSTAKAQKYPAKAVASAATAQTSASTIPVVVASAPNSPVNATLATSAASAAANNEVPTEVVVTGSRVIKNGDDSPTPVTMFSPQEMSEVHPGTLMDQLNDLPEISGSRGQYTNPSGGNQASVPTAPNAAEQVINLRNMGFTRTLILVDGHRVAPTGPDGTVDTTQIPQLLLQRVDIVTGGASAVYGADAVTGVVNFVYDTHFNGLKLNAQTSISHYGDDRASDIGIAGGTDLFGGKGHAEASYEYRDDPGVAHRSDRPFGRDVWTVENPTNGGTGPYVLFINDRSSNTSFGGFIAPQFNPASNPLTGMNFSSNGLLTPFVHGIPTVTNDSNESGGSGAYSDSTLKAALTMHQLFGRLDYDFTDRVHAYANLSGTYTYNREQSGNDTLNTPSGAGNAAISATDPFLPAQIQTELANAKVATFNLSKTFLDVPAANESTWERDYSINTGVNVKLGDGYEWETNFTSGRNLQNTRQNSNLNNLNMVAALNAVINPVNGQTVCAVSLTTSASLYPGCAPLNPFGPTSESQAALNYIEGRTQFWAFTTMSDATTSVTGAPVSTWAGPVNMALSAEWRRLSYTLEASAVPNDLNHEISCAGLTMNCTVGPAAQVWEVGVSAARSLVAVSVKEAAFEMDAPLLKNIFLAKDVSVNAAARWTDYSTSGTAWTWKVGLDWKFDDQWTLRATRSKDIRAPTLNDLYLPATTNTSGGPDYITNTNPITPPIPFISQGNPKLVPEIGNTTTAGVVYSPEWLQGFSVAVDSFFINVSNAIVNIQGNSNFAQEGCFNSGGTSFLCSLFVRPISCCNTSPANTLTALYSANVNIATQWTEGADFEANYANRLYDRPFSLRVLGTYQPHIFYASPGTISYDMAGVGFGNGTVQASPVWRWSAIGRISPFTNFTVSVMERWRSDLAWGPIQAPPNNLQFPMPKIEPVWYTDLNLSYLIKHEDVGQTEVFLNVQNLFNRQPPAAAFYNNGAPGVFGGFVIGDDPIGAYFTLGFRYRR
jgi:iron complex outermembrane receptor protein